MLWPKKCDLKVSYTPRKELIPVDTLSRALGTLLYDRLHVIQHDCWFYCTKPSVIYTNMELIKQSTHNDEDMVNLKEAILKEWPSENKNCAQSL